MTKSSCEGIKQHWDDSPLLARPFAVAGRQTCLNSSLRCDLEVLSYTRLGLARRKPVIAGIVDVSTTYFVAFGLNLGVNRAAEQIVGREPRERVSHQAFVN
jgi:hypothetical protein